MSLDLGQLPWICLRGQMNFSLPFVGVSDRMQFARLWQHVRGRTEQHPPLRLTATKTSHLENLHIRRRDWH